MTDQGVSTLKPPHWTVDAACLKAVVNEEQAPTDWDLQAGWTLSNQEAAELCSACPVFVQCFEGAQAEGADGVIRAGLAWLNGQPVKQREAEEASQAEARRRQVNKRKLEQGAARRKRMRARAAQPGPDCGTAEGLMRHRRAGATPCAACKTVKVERPPQPAWDTLTRGRDLCAKGHLLTEGNVKVRFMAGYWRWLCRECDRERVRRRPNRSKYPGVKGRPPLTSKSAESE